MHILAIPFTKGGGFKSTKPTGLAMESKGVVFMDPRERFHN
jgi:hypothetical protein